MHSDQIDSPVAKAKTAKRIWLWGSVGFALVAWLVFWWVSSHRISLTLPDGRVVSYNKILKGIRVSVSEFEPDVYAYSEKSFYPLVGRIMWSAGRIIPSLRKKHYDRNSYRPSPELLILSSSKQASSNDSLMVLLDDGFGKKQTMGYAYEYEPIFNNNEQLPMGSSSWRIEFHDKGQSAKHSRPLGEFSVPNPWFKSTPLFVGKNPPLVAQTSKGILRLLSTNCSTSEETYRRFVALEFDASACPALLPCHVIGIRITDSWGNTELQTGSPNEDGKTILANFNTSMQSGDWRIRIAICRGRGALFADNEVATYTHCMTSNYSSILGKRTINGRDLTLLHGAGVGGRRPGTDEWGDCFLDWQIDQKGPLLWPVLVKAIGQTTEGATIDIVPTNSQKQNPRAYYHVVPKRFINGALGGFTIAKDTLFSSGFMVPPDIVDFDLHIALEEPQVFEFFAKISNWPGATKTEGPRK